MLNRYLLVLTGFVLAAHTASAAPIVAGEYLTEGGWGRLLIAPAAQGKFSFTIMTLGANGHSCDLGGEIAHGQSTLDGDDKPPCVVKFRADTKLIAVSDNQASTCRHYCGARAGFTGEYLRIPATCGQEAREATRREFKQLYDRKSYPEALTRLQTLLEQCAATLDWLDSGLIRNDIAVTLHKLKQYPACREMLAPLVKDAKKSDEEIREDLPPIDAEAYLPILRATRTNLRLCAGKP